MEARIREPPNRPYCLDPNTVDLPQSIARSKCLEKNFASFHAIREERLTIATRDMAAKSGSPDHK